MATQLQDNPEFLHFVIYMGVHLTASNLHIYSDLYGNFAEWSPSTTCNSFAEKFIQWKRFYDEYKETQQLILNTNLFNTPPRDPRVLKATTVQLPHDLQQLNNQSTNFQHFILQNEPQPTQTLNCSPCSTEPPKDLSNDAQDLSIMDNNTLNEIVENVEILEVLEQSESENEKVVTLVGPGRPTKDDALLRDAQNEEESGHEVYAIREVLLLSGNGTIRKKKKLLTKQSDSDMKCFSIKHFTSLDYIAEKKRKAFLIIKKQRQKLKTLNYLELNTLKDMKDINNM